MLKSPNRVAFLLMISSVVLLLVFQTLWLISEYRNEREVLRKEITSTFRGVLLAMQDTVTQQNIQLLSPEGPRIVTRRVFEDSILHRGTLERSRAFSVVIGQSGQQDSERLTFVDSLGQRNVVIRFGRDSLSSDSIGFYFKKSLAKSGIDLPFKIIRIRRNASPPFTFADSEDELISEPVRVFPFDRYQASLSGFEMYLIKKITPQFFFSTFLTALTLLSFFVMYRSMRMQQRLVELKNDFISNVTHELKTPVATVSVAIEALKNFHALDNKERTTEYLNIAEHELNRLTMMTDKILNTSSDEVRYAKEPVNLDTIIQSVLDSLKLVFEKKEAIVNYGKEGEDFTVRGDVGHLTTVIFNLLDNALKYVEDIPLINVQVRTHDQVVEISVQDNGVGIPKEYQKKVFDKFFRVPTGNVHNSKGYGLGLSYVNQVVLAHGGTITIDSESDKGSIFTLRIPKGA